MPIDLKNIQWDSPAAGGGIDAAWDDEQPSLLGMAGEGVRASVGGTVETLGDWFGSEGMMNTGKAITGEQHKPQSLAQQMAKDIGYWGTDIATTLLPAGYLTKGVKGLKYLTKAGETVHKATKGKLPASFIPTLAHEAVTFGAVGAFHDGFRGAAEGAVTALPFAASRLPASRLLRMASMAATGTGLAALSGADKQEMASAGILMGLLGGLAPQLRDKVQQIANEKPDANLKDVFVEAGVPKAQLKMVFEPMKIDPLITRDYIPTRNTHFQGPLLKPGQMGFEFKPQQVTIPEAQVIEVPGATKRTAADVAKTFEEAGQLPTERLLDAVDTLTGERYSPRQLQMKMDLQLKDKGGERRGDPELRAKVDEVLRDYADEFEGLSREEVIQFALNRAYVSDLTGLRNKLAHKRDLARPEHTQPIQVSLDVNGLKWFNDSFGHIAGDALLKRMGEVLQREGGEGSKVYHLSGDEFAFQARTMAEADALIGRLRHALANESVSIMDADGRLRTFKGFGTGAGKGKSFAEAEIDLKTDKEAAIGRGERSTERGGRPPQLREVFPDGDAQRTVPSSPHEVGTDRHASVLNPEATRTALDRFPEEEWARMAEVQRIQEAAPRMNADLYEPPVKPPIQVAEVSMEAPRAEIPALPSDEASLRKRMKEIEAQHSGMLESVERTPEADAIRREWSGIVSKLQELTIAKEELPKEPVAKAKKIAEKIVIPQSERMVEPEFQDMDLVIASKPTKPGVLAKEEIRKRLLAARTKKETPKKRETASTPEKPLQITPEDIEIKRQHQEVMQKLLKNPGAMLTDAEQQVLIAAGKLKRKTLTVEELQEAEGKFRDEVDNTRLKISLDELAESERLPHGPKLYSGLPLDEMMQTVRPLVDSVVSATTLTAKDVANSLRKVFRVPYWHERLSDLSVALRNIEDVAAEMTNLSQERMKKYLTLKDDNIKKMVDGLILRGDAEGRRATPEELAKLPELGREAYQGVVDGLEFMHKRFLRRAMRQLFGETLAPEEIAKFYDIPRDKYKGMSIEDRKVLKEKAVYAETEKFLSEHYVPGYFPRYRFGRFVALVTRGKDNKLMHVEAFDKPADAEALLGRFENVGPDTRVVDLKEVGGDYRQTMSLGSYLPMIDRILGKGKIADLEMQKMKELFGAQWAEYIENASQGRLLHRINIPGYSTDVRKSLVTYTENFPNAVMRAAAKPKINTIVESMPEAQGTRKYANDLVDYFYGRTNREGGWNLAARQGMYLFYLGLKPAYGALNWTQRLTMTLPWMVDAVATGRGVGWAQASAEAGKVWANAQGKQMKLFKDFVGSMAAGKRTRYIDLIRKADYLNRDEKLVLLRLFRRGEMKQLRQIDVAGGESRVMRTLDVFGMLSERSNRVHAALAGAELYSGLGMRGTKLVGQVDNFLHATQIMYSKANRPVLGRGVLAPAFVFKSYMFNFLSMYWHLMKQDNKAGFITGVGTMLALGGVAGLPLYTQEVDAVVDYFMSSVVKDPSWPVTKRQIANSMNQGMAKYLVNGIPSALGLDGASAVGFPDVTGLAIAPLVKATLKLPENINREDMTTAEKYRAFLPSQVKNLWNFYKLTKYGAPTDSTGKLLFGEKDIQSLPPELREMGMELYQKLPRNLTVTDKVAVALGFPTIAVNKYYGDVDAIRQARRDSNSLKGEYHRAVARAMADGDDAKVEKLIAAAEKRGLQLNSEAVWGHLTDYEEALRNEEEGE